MPDKIEIVDYKPEYAKAWHDLNLAWISEIFVVEEEDRAVLTDPQKYLLDNGGAIIIALLNGEPVGTCALRRINADLVEMCKMTVAKFVRGKNIGRMLGEAIIEKASQIGASTIELYSNRKGSEVAIEMYKKLGFVEIPMTGAAVYARADIKMRLML
ncbi:MAG: GNAT family N-acetyltransferase [Chitinophagaceae bacterium]|nr:GNAT family N-acetyltransferase [Chitinophagaceae bacterium]